MKISTRIALTGALIVFSLTHGYADTLDLNRIVVTASRVEEAKESVARTIDVVSTEDIDTTAARDVADLLTRLTAVNIIDNGGIGAAKSIRMRGSSASQVLVMVDGRPINSPRDGEVDLSTISLETVDRIEVVHGPASSLYGSSAMGGTVNIITKAPPKEKAETLLDSSFGSFRTYNEKLVHGARIGSFGYLVTGNYIDSEGFRDNAEFDAKNFSSKFEYELNANNLLKASSGFYKSLLGTPGTLSAPDSDDKQRTMKKFGEFAWEFRPDSETIFANKLTRSYERLEFLENTAGSLYDIANDKSVHTTTVDSAETQLSRQFTDRYQMVGGLTYIINRNNSTKSAKHRYLVKAGYLENKFSLTDTFNVNLGGRLDDYSNFGTEFSPSFSFMYQPHAKAKLHGLIARSFRAPTFNDLYWPDEGWARGNPDVKPEKAVSGEIGIGISPWEAFSSDITYFHSDFNDLIAWAESAGVWMPSNVSSAVIDGVECANTLRLNEALSLGLDYTFLRAKNDKTGTYLIYRPKHKFDATLTYKAPLGILLAGSVQFTDTRFHDEANTIKVKRFYTVGFSASRKMTANLEAYLAVDNLLDKQYQTTRDFPMPGASVTAGLKAKF